MTPRENTSGPKAVGVVGAGNMGSGIAQKYATEGFEVVVVDITEEAAQKGRERVETTLNEGVARKIFTEEKRDAILSRMTFTADREKLKKVALVIEAIFENRQVKQDLFTDLGERLPAETILATNTSSFFVQDLAKVTQHPERVVGLHYFYHPAKNRLVEVIKAEATDQRSFEKAWELQEGSGKTPISSTDRPGFVVNRFFVPWLNESMRLVSEGVADIPTVEAAAKKAFGIGMGPFELMNVTGVPITLHAATTLGEELGPFYAPCDLIRPVVEKGDNWDLSGEADQSKFDLVGQRLSGVVFQIACTLVLEEGVCTVEDCDLGARVGLRWPKGPFELMNDLGTQEALARVEAIANLYDDVAIPQALQDQGTKNQNFELKQLSVEIDDGVGTITLNRPDAMNALNEEVMVQLGEAFDRLTHDASVQGIVIAGRGKAFVAGADTKFFVDQIRADNVERIVRFAADGQEILRRIDLSTKPVICRLDGLSLGGGSELALACDQIIATADGSLGFPETGIGIYPGLGGTQRSARRVGIPLARWLVLTGAPLSAKMALGLGLVDEVVEKESLDARLRELALGGQTADEKRPPQKAPQGFEAWWDAFSAPLEDLLEGTVSIEGPQAEKIQKAIGKVRFKAPLAIQAADKLIQNTQEWSLADGLKAETQGLSSIFGSSDALEGLSSLGRRRPSFEGK